MRGAGTRILAAMPKITLRQLDYFRAAARAGSISAAAEVEHVSRSSITAAIDELERILGVTLTVRSKGAGIVLTPIGSKVCNEAEGLLEHAAAIERLGKGALPAGVLTVGCFPSLAPTVMANAWAVMSEMYPEIRLEVVSAPRNDLVEMVQSGKIDCAVAYNLQTFPGLVATALYDTEMHVILAADHPLSSKPVVEADDLADFPLILMDVEPSVSDVMTYFDNCGIQPRILTRTSNFEFIRSLVARGLGYSLFLQRPRHGMSYEGRPIIARPLSPTPPRERATIAWSAEKSRSEVLRVFESVLRDCFKELTVS